MGFKNTFTYKLFKSSNSQKQNGEKGIALIFAIFTLVIIMFMVTELTYQASVEYNVNAQGITRLKAYYAAKSGVDLSLLRIKIYNQVLSQFGDKIPAGQLPIIEKIWSFPFQWPPPVSNEVNQVDKGLIEDSVKESLMDTVYITNISDEGSKIDVNDLNSPSKYLQEITRNQILTIFENKKTSDEEWARKHQDVRFEELVNNIADWVDLDKEGRNGSDESSYYQDLTKGMNNVSLPPNRGFRTLDEVRMVHGMKDEFFDLLKDQITVYGMKAINPNSAPIEVIKSLDKSITDPVAQEILKRRSGEIPGGPFGSNDDFWDFVNGAGGQVSAEVQQKLPLTYDTVNNFRIVSTGSYGKTQRQITAIVYDVTSAAQRVADQVTKEKKDAEAPAAGETTGEKPAPEAEKTKPKKEPLPKGPPRVVYWTED